MNGKLIQFERFIRLWAPGLVICGLLTIAGEAQEPIRQIAAPLPRLVRTGSSVESSGKKMRVVLGISNWDKYPDEMFDLSGGHSSSSGTCGTDSRVVIAVYTRPGDLIAECIGVARPADLSRFSIVFQRGRFADDLVYAVITDRYTGAAYRSNLISIGPAETPPRKHER